MAIQEMLIGLHVVAIETESLKLGCLHCPPPPTSPSCVHPELLKLRNTLAHHLGNVVEKGAQRSRLAQLPAVLADRRVCQYCPQRRNCALYER